MFVFHAQAVEKCIHLNQKRLLSSIGVWHLVFGHSLPPVHSGGRLLLGGAVCATAVLDRSMPAPYSQDLRDLWFVWSLGLSVEEAAFYLGVSTWTVERYLTKLTNTGGVSTKTLGRPTGKLKELLVLEAILKNPDKTYSEILDELYSHRF